MYINRKQTRNIGSDSRVTTAFHSRLGPIVCTPCIPVGLYTLYRLPGCPDSFGIDEYGTRPRLCTPTGLATNKIRLGGLQIDERK